jgi:exodeoxyribonuclease VII small subunit
VSDPLLDGGLDDVLDRLEEVIGRLSDPAAPLDRLVTDHEAAGRLVEAAQARLRAAEARVAGREPEPPRPR